MTLSSRLRGEMRAERRALSPRQQRKHSLAMARRIVRWHPFMKARRIAFYISSDGEMDLAPVIEHSRRAGKRIYLPVLHPFGGNKLWFSEWCHGDNLRLNRFAIPEPVARLRKPLFAIRLDLILMPLVAFDSYCMRVGMGGGYYDRSLSFRNRHPRMKRPLLVGVAHELQHVRRLSARAWDVTTDAVVTEQRILDCRHKERDGICRLPEAVD